MTHNDYSHSRLDFLRPVLGRVRNSDSFSCDPVLRLSVELLPKVLASMPAIAPLIVAPVLVAKGTQRPVCKCGQPCRWYGPVGGYSKQCEDCNNADAVKRRLRSQRKR